MKNTRVIDTPVNCTNSDDIITPNRAAKTMNSTSAVAAVIFSMRQLMKNTSPIVARNSTISDGRLKIIWPNAVRPVKPRGPRTIASPPAAWKVNQATTPVAATPMAM